MPPCSRGRGFSRYIFFGTSICPEQPDGMLKKSIGLIACVQLGTAHWKHLEKQANWLVAQWATVQGFLFGGRGNTD